jgi:hypothetical protein
LIKISDNALHPHLKARMLQRGVKVEEIERVLNEGWDVTDSKSGTLGKVFVFPYNGIWEGKLFEEKEVTVYYKLVNDRMMLLTVKARYGKGFLKEEENHEVRI